MTRFGLDYSFAAPISPAQHHSVGSTFAVRYLNGNFPKRMNREEADMLQRGGIDVVVVFESAAKRALDGRAAGVADAQFAVSEARVLGMPEDRPVYFAVDFDATPADQPAINDYLRGVNGVLGVKRTGIYGGYWPCSRAANSGLVGYIYQTYAWSGRNLDKRANIYQYSNGHSVAGHAVDYNHALRSDFGQWSVRAPEPKPVAEPKGSWHFEGHVDMDSGSWHIQPQPGQDVHMGEHDRWWAAQVEVNEKDGLWRIVGKPFDK